MKAEHLPAKVCSGLSHEMFSEQKPEIPLAGRLSSVAVFMIAISSKKAIAKHFSRPLFPPPSAATHHTSNGNVRPKATSGFWLNMLIDAALLLLQRTNCTTNCTSADESHRFSFSPSKNHFLLDGAAEGSRSPANESSCNYSRSSSFPNTMQRWSLSELL